MTIRKVSAHTNAVGTHIRSAWRREESNGTTYDVDLGHQVPYHHVDADYVITDAMSRKPAPYQGDHRTAYDYWRGVDLVTEDTPIIRRHKYTNPVDGQTSNYDYESTEYISKLRTPFSSSPVNGPAIENAWNESINDALQSLKGNTSEVGASLGELKSSVDLLAGTVTRGAHFLHFMRRGQFLKAANTLGLSRAAFTNNRGRNLASYWLAYSYGWKPYAQTCYDIAQTLHDIVNRTSNSVEGTGTAFHAEKREGTWMGLTETNNHQAGVKTVLKASITSEKIRNLNRMGLTNPVGIAWELVPFSFAVDWFVPVGNTLDAMTASQGLTWHGGFTSKKIYSENHITHREGRETDWTEVTSGGSYREVHAEFQRVAYTNFPWARLYADMTPYSTPRAVNALALVRKLT